MGVINGWQKGKIADDEITFKLIKEQTSGDFVNAHNTLFPGIMGTVPHQHQNFDKKYNGHC